MPRKHVFRENDRVRIKVGRVVTRVGYPLSLADAIEQMPNLWEAVHAACETAGLRPPVRDTLLRDQPDILRSTSPYAKVARELAWLWLRQNKFGGPERSLHFEDRPKILGRECTVWHKKVVQTGTRCPGGGGWYQTADFGREYDYQPPSLANRQTHVLLDLGIDASEGRFMSGRDLEKGVWVHSGDVEPVAAL